MTDDFVLIYHLIVDGMQLFESYKCEEAYILLVKFILQNSNLDL